MLVCVSSLLLVVILRGLFWVVLCFGVIWFLLLGLFCCVLPFDCWIMLLGFVLRWFAYICG